MFRYSTYITVPPLFGILMSLAALLTGIISNDKIASTDPTLRMAPLYGISHYSVFR